MSATLDWALVGEVAHVASEFVGIAPEDRPEGRCPCCAEVVVWKAGDVQTPHVAHRPESVCLATSPETAEHINAKATLTRVLSSTNHVRIAGSCRGGHDVTMAWQIPSWEHVVPEYRIGSRRPDVALLGRGREGLAAIEVLHTHAVDEAKAADLAAAGLPWIEVRSLVALSWDRESPLQIVTADAVTLAGFDAACEACAKQRALNDRRAVEQAEINARWAEINARWAAGAPERARAAAEFALRAAEAVKADKERKQRAFEKAIEQAEFDHAANAAMRIQSRLFTSLSSDPKCLSIAIYGGQPYRSHYVVGAMVMRDGAHPRCAQAPCVGPDADWLALDFALAWLEQTAPGRSAIIYTSADYTAIGVHSSWGGDDEVQRRVRAAVKRTGSAVIREPDESRHWNNLLQDYAVGVIWESPIEYSYPHVPLRWEPWWCAWADSQRYSDDLDAGFARALDRDETSSRPLTLAPQATP